MNVREQVCRGVAAALAVFAAWAAAGDDEARPWWDHFPRIVQTNDPAAARAHHATVVFTGDHADPGWGTYGQMMSDGSGRLAEFRQAGMKVISYFETFGQTYCYLAAVGPWNGTDLTPRAAMHWNWQDYAGGTRRWIGVQNFFDDEPFARPWTRTHPVYGAPPMHYPDGTVATGYFHDDPTDPRNSRVFDACLSKDLWGRLGAEYYFNDVVNAVDPATGKRRGPLDGTLAVEGKHAGLIMFLKDSACPDWNHYTAASTGLAAASGLDGMWSDNWSGWDSLGRPALTKAFGEWSVARFRDYLHDNFTPEQRAALGVEAVEGFDVREALREKARAFGGTGEDVNDPAWRDARWLDDPLWHAYLIFKRRTGTEALDAYYAAAKGAARDAGVDEFLVSGNDIGIMSFGWPRGNLDLASFELSTGWSICAGSRGIGLPPEGRFAPRYKLAREHAKSRFTNVWLYNEGAREKLAQPNTVSVLYYEMLANHALPMFQPGHDHVAGTDEVNAGFFGFVERAAEVFGGRTPMEDVGILYSSSSLLCFLTPHDHYAFDAQPHQFGYYGWATALGELHQQYRFVPEWKLTAETLKGLRLLVIPNAVSLDPAAAREVIAPWVASGGRLIVTGESGTRLGEAGNFARNPAGSCLATLTGPDGPEGVWYLPGTPGMDYFLRRGERPARLEELRAGLGRLMQGAPAAVLGNCADVPATVGLTVYADAAARRLFIDVNNFDIDVETDSLRAAAALTFDVALPDWLARPRVADVVTPGPDGARVDAVSGGRATITVDVCPLYASVVLEPAP